MLAAATLNTPLQLLRPTPVGAVAGVRRTGAPATVASVRGALRPLRLGERVAMGGERTSATHRLVLRRPLPSGAGIRPSDTVHVTAGPLAGQVFAIDSVEAQRDRFVVMLKGQQAEEVR